MKGNRMRNVVLFSALTLMVFVTGCAGLAKFFAPS